MHVGEKDAAGCVRRVGSFSVDVSMVIFNKKKESTNNLNIGELPRFLGSK